MKPQDFPEFSDRDWPEDFERENGMYQNTCIYCKKFFFGYKRRVVCKICNKEIAEKIYKNTKDMKDVLSNL